MSLFGKPERVGALESIINHFFNKINFIETEHLSNHFGHLYQLFDM